MSEKVATIKQAINSFTLFCKVEGKSAARLTVTHINSRASCDMVLNSSGIPTA